MDRGADPDDDRRDHVRQSLLAFTKYHKCCILY